MSPSFLHKKNRIQIELKRRKRILMILRQELI